MKPEITNVAFSTALTFELVTQYDFSTLGAPTFPTLRKEVIYRTDNPSHSIVLFLQYRLSDHITSNAASLRETWGVPYYRFLVHPQNRTQRHELLSSLENLNALVYYAAPAFHTMGALYDSLMKKRILENSIFWSPLQVGGLTQKKKNTISYRSNLDYGILEPGNIRIEHMVRGRKLLDILQEQFESNRAEIYDDTKIFQLGDQMLENYLNHFPTGRARKLIKDIKKGRDHIDARDYLSLISTLLYDSHVYFVTK